VCLTRKSSPLAQPPKLERVGSRSGMVPCTNFRDIRWSCSFLADVSFPIQIFCTARCQGSDILEETSRIICCFYIPLGRMYQCTLGVYILTRISLLLGWAYQKTVYSELPGRGVGTCLYYHYCCRQPLN